MQHSSYSLTRFYLYESNTIDTRIKDLTLSKTGTNELLHLNYQKNYILAASLEEQSHVTRSGRNLNNIQELTKHPLSSLKIHSYPLKFVKYIYKFMFHRFKRCIYSVIIIKIL